jgi:hypothetical protein
MTLLHSRHWPKAGEIRDYPPYSQSSHAPAGRLCASAVRLARHGPLISLSGRASKTYRHKRKTRPGGQPDGSSYMGAWGGWALAPNTASMGRDNRSHIYWSPQGRRTFKRPTIFLTFWQEFSERFQAKACPALDAGWRPVRVRKTRQIKNLEPRFDSIETENHCAAGRLASPTADLSDAMAAEGWSRALVAGTSCRAETFSAAGVSETAATGVAGAMATAETAA